MGVILYGEVQIGEGAHIGDGTIIGSPAIDDLDPEQELDETVIGPGTCIGAYAVIHNGATLRPRVRVDDRCVVGPEAVIGEEARLYYGARLFWKVEVGRRAIVSGFCCDRSYVGADARMFGSLIHAMRDPHQNWDTEEPSPRVEAHAFVGFDALVIGAVTIGREAYVAAGAIVTRDVPARGKVIGKH